MFVILLKYYSIFTISHVPPYPLSSFSHRKLNYAKIMILFDLSPYGVVKRNFVLYPHSLLFNPHTYYIVAPFKVCYYSYNADMPLILLLFM